MKRRILFVAVLASVLAGAGQSKADTITASLTPDGGGPNAAIPSGPDPIVSFTFSDLAGDKGYGTLSAIDSGLADGSLLATSGTFTLTQSSLNAVPTGTYNLVSIPGAPGVYTSPNGAYYYDDLIYTNEQAGSGVNPGFSSNPSYLTYWGLVFGEPSGLEFNLYGNGSGNYAFLAGFGAGNYPIDQLSGVTYTDGVVPESSTLTLLGIGAAGLGVFRLRRRKLAQS